MPKGIDNIARSLAQSGGSENPTFETVTATGYIQGKKTGVFAYLSAPDNTTITTGGTYYPVEGTFTNSPVEEFSAGTVYTPSIKYNGTLKRYFEVDWHVQVQCNSFNADVGVAVKINDVLCERGEMEIKCLQANEPYNMSSTCVVELDEGDEVQLVVTSDGDGDIVTFGKFVTTIKPFYW